METNPTQNFFLFILMIYEVMFGIIYINDLWNYIWKGVSHVYPVHRELIVKGEARVRSRGRPKFNSN